MPIYLGVSYYSVVNDIAPRTNTEKYRPMLHLHANIMLRGLAPPLGTLV